MKSLNIIKDRLLQRQLDDAMFKTSRYPEYKKYWDRYTYFCANSVIHLASDERSALSLNLLKAYLQDESQVYLLKKAEDKAWDAMYSVHKDVCAAIEDGSMSFKRKTLGASIEASRAANYAVLSVKENNAFLRETVIYNCDDALRASGCYNKRKETKQNLIDEFKRCITCIELSKDYNFE